MVGFEITYDKNTEVSFKAWKQELFIYAIIVKSKIKKEPKFCVFNKNRPKRQKECIPEQNLFENYIRNYLHSFALEI